MTSFLLKIIGIISMLSDHIGDAIIGHFSNFNLIGRIAFPIFAFQAVQGYLHTRDFKKYMQRLFIFALISQFPFTLFLSTFTKTIYLNIFFTFMLGLLALFLYDKCKNKLIGVMAVIICSVVGELIKVDYGAFGILLIFNFYFFEAEFEKLCNFQSVKLFNKNILCKKYLMSITTIILCFAKYLQNIIKTPMLKTHYLKCGLFTSLSLIFILAYNQKQGAKLKYLFYIFYPLHLLILYLIHIYK